MKYVILLILLVGSEEVNQLIKYIKQTVCLKFTEICARCCKCKQCAL